MADVIMSWGECDVQVGVTGLNDAMSAALSSIGTVKEKSTNIEQDDGEKLQAYATGHKLVAQEEQDGDIKLSARIIEPSLEFLGELFDADFSDVDKTLKVRSMLVAGNYSVQVTPKNVGGKGIRIRKSNVKVRFGITEEEGFFADFTFTVVVCADNELYELFEKPAT